MLHLIRKPLITEKSLMQAQQENVYLFEVDPMANKHQIKNLIEKTYKVEVVSVRTVMQPVKNKRTGRRRVSTPTSPKKKAFVHLKAGQKIEIFEVMTG